MTWLKKIFFYFLFAWIWLFLFIVHICIENPQQTDFSWFDQVVFATSFILFPVGSILKGDAFFLLFVFLQFSFWALVSFTTYLIFQVVRKKFKS